MDHLKRKLTTLPPKTWLWLIIALGIAARLLAVLIMGDRVEVLPGIYDQVSYHTLATRLLDGHGFTFSTEWWPVTQPNQPTAHWSYLYTFYLTAIYALFGVHPLAARLLQALVVGVAMPLLAYRLASYLSPGPSPAGKGGKEGLRTPLPEEVGARDEGSFPADSPSLPLPPDPSPLVDRWRRLKSSLRAHPELLSLLAAAWVAFYPYFIYYSAALMTEMFYITAILWSLDIAIRLAYSRKYFLRPRRWGTFALLGLVLGVAVLLRQVYLAFVPFLLAWLALTLGFSRHIPRAGGEHLSPSPSPAGKGGKDVPSPADEGRSLSLDGRGVRGEGASSSPRPSLFTHLSGPLLSLLILTLTILPFTLWNYHQFGEFVMLNTNAGYAFFWANHPVHGNDFVALFTPEMPSYQSLIPAEMRSLDEAALEKELMRRGVGFVLADPWRYLRLSLSRIDDHFYFMPSRDSSRLSNLTRVSSLGVALPFMLLGMLAWILQSNRQLTGSWLRRLGNLLAEPGGLLLLFIAVYVSVHLLSWAGIRYRLPTDAVMLLFAAYSISSYPRGNE